MGLMPEQFWLLEFREFQIKHAAFTRSEDRQHSLVIRLALMTSSYKDGERAQMQKTANALKRYPIKPWLRRS